MMDEHKTDKEKYTQAINELRVLWNEFDPIGVTEWVDDEYDSYLDQTYSLLHQKTDLLELKTFIKKILTDNMGLIRDDGVCEDFAIKLLNWNNGQS